MIDKFTLSLWLNGCHAPSVLMIDDLSDAYIDKYKEKYKNDWGYLTDTEDSCYSYLSKHLLATFPEIKISFFVPYLRHNVIADESHVIKNNIADREVFVRFIKKLITKGHEIAYHGSNHGIYENGDWIQEWELFKSQEEADRSVKAGIEYFEKELGIKISGGKYCGYKYNCFSDQSIVSNKLKFWCKDATLDLDADISVNSNNLLEFPTNLAGNTFIRYLYKKEVLWKDLLSRFLYPIQWLKNKKVEDKIRKSILCGKVISIQEHYSPSTTRGLVQSCNVISDIKSLRRIYTLLRGYDIWHATCSEIVDYHLLREATCIVIKGNMINVKVGLSNKKNSKVTIECPQEFIFSDSKGVYFKSERKRNKHFLTIPVSTGDNIFTVN